MALEYKVLERFSEQARKTVAERVFVKGMTTGEDGLPLRAFVCAKGLCVMAALMQEDGITIESRVPSESKVADKLGIVKYDGTHNQTFEYSEIIEIVGMNDCGKLTTPEAVRALLLGE